jgi:hypothetical protein
MGFIVGGVGMRMTVEPQGGGVVENAKRKTSKQDRISPEINEFMHLLSSLDGKFGAKPAQSR